MLKGKDDRRLYFYFSIITFSIGIILLLIFSYSKYFVEPEIVPLLSLEEDINENYKKAYLKLKDPQIFARYENFDIHSRSIEAILRVYDKKIDSGEGFEKNDKIYLQILLDRREKGARLTIFTSIFFFLLSLLGLIFFLFEIRQNREVIEKV